MIFVTDDPAKWGNGLGRPALAPEVDGNFWETKQRLDSLEQSPLQPVSIDSITEDNGELTVHLSNGTTQGPFPIPSSAPTMRGNWQPTVPYRENDVIRVPALGFYWVLQDHTSAAVFDPAATQGGNPIYQFMWPAPTYDLSLFVPGTPGQGMTPGDPVFMHVVTRAFTLPQDLDGSRLRLGSAPAAPLTGIFSRNGAPVAGAGFSFAAGATVAAIAFPAAIDLLPDDVFTVELTSAADATARNLAATLVGWPAS